jgi:hypothetical protein
MSKIPNQSKARKGNRRIDKPDLYFLISLVYLLIIRYCSYCPATGLRGVCCCCVGAVGFAAVVLPDVVDSCCPPSLLAVGISINGTAPPSLSPPVTEGNFPSHLVALSHSKYVGLLLNCWSKWNLQR